MNTERLHAIANALQAEISAGSLGTLQELVAALRQASQDPAQQTTVSSLRGRLEGQLREAPSNGFSPAWREALQSVAEEADTKMAAEIEEFVEELLEKAEPLEKGRANELRTELKDALNSLANRIDRGYTLEVRAGDLPEPDKDEEGTPSDPGHAELRETVEAVQASQERIKFVELSGKPILELPEAEDKATPGTHER